MKQCYKKATLFLMLFISFSCNQLPQNVEDDYCTIKARTKFMEIEVKGKVLSRRTYAGIQGITDKKEREAYLTKQENSNPELYSRLSKEDTVLINQFVRLGLIRGNEFLINNFNPQTKDTCSLLQQSGEKLQLKFYNDSATGKIWFNMYFKEDSLKINTGATTLQNLDYAFLDVIPGGNKELVFLDDYYIMNGDNFDFQVYEIKTN
jgi:hypothetical protein